MCSMLVLADGKRTRYIDVLRICSFKVRDIFMLHERGSEKPLNLQHPQFLQILQKPQRLFADVL